MSLVPSYLTYFRVTLSAPTAHRTIQEHPRLHHNKALYGFIRALICIYAPEPSEPGGKAFVYIKPYFTALKVNRVRT